MLVSLNEIKKLVQIPSGVSTDELVKLIGSRLVEVEGTIDLAKKYTTNITPRIDGRVIVGLSEALGSEDYIHGYVETSNPRCNAHCRYPSNDGGGGGNSDHLNCYEIFDPIEVEDIYDYCHKDENIEKVRIDGKLSSLLLFSFTPLILFLLILCR